MLLDLPKEDFIAECSEDECVVIAATEHFGDGVGRVAKHLDPEPATIHIGRCLKLVFRHRGAAA